MKLNQLIAEQKVSTGSQEESLEYLYKNIIFSLGNPDSNTKFLDYLKTSTSKTPATDYYKQEAEKRGIKREIEGRRAKFEVRSDGSVLKRSTENMSFRIYNFDEFGPPPFKFGAGQNESSQLLEEFTMTNYASSLKKVDWWFPSSVVSMHIFRSGLESLSGFDKHVYLCSDLVLQFNHNFKGHGLLSLLRSKVYSFTWVDHKAETAIMNKYLSSKDRDVFECQEELIEAGFPECATL